MPDPLLALARLPGVASSVAAADAAVAAMLQGRGRRRISDEQVAAALLDSARASAELEATEAAPAAAWEPGAVRAATELPRLATTRLPAGQLLARLHTLLAYGIAAPDQLGRVRPPSGGDRLNGLLDLLAPGGGSPLVRAAVVHAEVLELAPFEQGNGMVARAAAHVVLIGAGIDPRPVLPLARGHLELRADYAAALRGYRTGRVDGVSAWLEHCARALVRAAELSPLAHPESTATADVGEP